jgi:hypothetical protein
MYDQDHIYYNLFPILDHQIIQIHSYRFCLRFPSLSVQSFHHRMIETLMAYQSPPTFSLEPIPKLAFYRQ